MSDSESAEKFTLNVTAHGANEWSNFSVLDGDKKLVAYETGSFAVELPKGLYTVLKESGSSMSREIVILNENKTLPSTKIPTPPSNNKEANRKKFSRIAQQQSQNYSEAMSDSPANLSSLFMFMNVDRKDYKKSWFEIEELFEILDNDYLPISNNSEWNINIDEGWLSYHQLLEPGTYYLNYQGKESRTLPIELFENNQTQISLSFNEEPNFNDFQINMSPDFYFEPDAKGKKSFKIALSKLNYKDFNVSKKVLEDLAYGKWKNPMYGLVVSYIYLKSRSHKHDKLFNTVVNNLEHKILDSENSADLNLIKFLNNLHNNGDLISALSGETPQFDAPPIMRVGMETIIDLSFKFPDIIKKGSRVDLISDRLYYDIPWTSFKPFDRKSVFFNKNLLNINQFNFEKFDKDEFSMEEEGDYRDGIEYEVGDIEESAEFADNEASKRIEIPDSVLEIILPLVDIFHRKELDDKITINFLARTFGIPPVSYKRKIKILKLFLKENKNIESSIKKLVEENIDLKLSSDSLKQVLKLIRRL